MHSHELEEFLKKEDALAKQRREAVRKIRETSEHETDELLRSIKPKVSAAQFDELKHRLQKKTTTFKEAVDSLKGLVRAVTTLLGVYAAAFVLAPMFMKFLHALVEVPVPVGEELDVNGIQSKFYEGVNDLNVTMFSNWDEKSRKIALFTADRCWVVVRRILAAIETRSVLVPKSLMPSPQ